MSPSDEELLLAAGAGDLPAFREIIGRHRDALWRAVRARVRDDETGEDVLQETLLGAWRGAAGFRGEGSARAWLLGLARRNAARAWRRRAGEPASFEPLPDAGARAGWGSADPERAAVAAEDAVRLDLALASLTASDRELILLRDREGLPGAEVAAQLGLPVGAMKSRLHRARLHLMAALREGGIDGE